MNNNFFKKIKINLGAAAFLMLFVATPALAGSIYGNSGPDLGLAYPATSGLNDGDVRVTTARILRVALSLLGTIFVVIIVWGGYEWMTAGGNDQQIGTAKKRIFTGIIGLAVILSSYAIAYFIINSISTAAVSGSSPGSIHY
jgi:hypothetical protein